MKTKQNKLRLGEEVELDGTAYYVRHICRGEGQARTIARQRTNHFYRPVRGQWAVIQPKERQTVSDLTKSE